MVGTPPPDQHADGKIPGNIYQRRDRPAVELASARAPLKLGPHRHPDHDLLTLVVKGNHLQAKPPDERRAIKHRLHIRRRKLRG